MGGACGMYGTEEKRIQGCCGGPKGRRLLGIGRSRLEYNIQMDLQGIS
jgi:hypothetical protein